MRCFTRKLDPVSNIALDMRPPLHSHIALSLDDPLRGAVLAAGLTDEIKADTSDLVEFFLSAREKHFEIKMREIF